MMNYPFRTALIAYLLGGDADEFRETLESLRENYPPHAFYSLMNFLSTHDTPRILTVLGADRVPGSKEERAVFRLSPAERQLGLKRLRLAALVLFTFPGAPTVYYGDEAGMEGWEDPFNRAGYPWGAGGFRIEIFLFQPCPSAPGAARITDRAAALALDGRLPAGLCQRAGRSTADHCGQRR